MITLKDWLPEEALMFDDEPFHKFVDVNVVQEYSMFDEDEWKSWIGTHKNVTSWCMLENGYAVGWNENPSRGWSFPVKKVK